MGSSSSKGGGGAGSQRYNYYGSIAGLVCGGRTSRLKGIEVDDEMKWTGSIDEATSPNPVVITVPEHGPLEYWWGRPDQVTPAPLLTAAYNTLGHDHPAYTSISYFVLKDFLFGLEKRQAPKIRIHFERAPEQTLITGPAAQLQDGQANPWCVLAELYTSRRWGAGLPASLFDTVSWQAMADLALAKHTRTYVSVLLTEQTSGKAISDELLALCDGWRRAQQGTGRCEAGRFTPPELIDPESLPLIDDSWRTADPEWDEDTWSDVYTRVVVTYRDRAKNFKQRPAKYDDPSARQTISKRRTKKINAEHIVRADQALAYAQVLGSRLAVPGATGKLAVRPEKAAALRPGQHVRVDIDPEPGGTQRRKVCRIVKITRTIEGSTTLEVETERQLEAEIYTPPAIIPPAPPQTVIPEVSHLRFVEAPYGLAQDEPYRILALASRPEAMVTAFRVHYSDVDGGEFSPLGDSRAYALRGRLNLAYGASATGPVSVELLDSLNRELIDENPGDTGARNDTLLLVLLKIAGNGQIAADGEDKAWVEILSVSEVTAAAANVVDVTALRARLGTPAREFLQHAEAWFVRRSALTLLEHADFPGKGQAGQSVYFKLQPSGPLGERPIEECTQRTFSFALERELPPTVVDDGITPNAVTDVTLTAGFNEIWIQFTPPGNTPIRRIRIYESTTSTRPAEPSLFVAGAANFAVRAGLPEGVTRYYWLEPHGENNRLGPIVGPYSAATPEFPLATIEQTLTNLTTALGKMVTRGAAPPNDPPAGAVWYDTGDNSIPKVWDGAAWQPTPDARVSALQSQINDPATGLPATRAEVFQGIATLTANDQALANSLSQVSATASSAQSAASNAQGTANAAQGAASAAQNSADAAQGTANNAQTAANNAATAAAAAQTTANAAATAASTAQATADGAASSATTAQNTANTALTTASGAQSTANAAASAASAAQTTADSAAASATSAVSAATTAQNTANAAASTASAAVTAASTAQAGVNTLAAEYVLQVVTNAGGQRRLAGFRITNQGGAGGSTEMVFQADRFVLVNGSGEQASQPFVIDTNGVVYINTAVFKDATIGSAKIASLIVDKLDSGTMTAKEVVFAGGAAGILRSDTFAPGVSGWRMRANGDAEFNDVTVRGKLLASLVGTNSAFFHPAAPNSSFPAAVLASGFTNVFHRWDTYMQQDYDEWGNPIGDPYPVQYHAAGEAYYPLCAIYGWATGAGFSTSRFGKSDMTLLITGATAWDIQNYGGGLSHADVNAAYRINGGGWTLIANGVRHTLGGGPHLSFGGPAQITGLSGTETIEFGVRVNTPAPQYHNGTWLNVLALNA